MHNEAGNKARAVAETTEPVRVLVYPDQNIHEEVRQEITKNDSDENGGAIAPMTLQNVEGSSVHFSTNPVSYVPKVQNGTSSISTDYTWKYDLVPNLEDLYIVQLAKNIINFKKSKFEELKDFLANKVNRWENILTNEKSKLEDFIANNDVSASNILTNEKSKLENFFANNDVLASVKDFKDAKLEDLVELIKLKKLKVEELIALNQLLELKQSKIQEVKNLINLKKSKVEDLLSNSVDVVTAPLAQYVNFNPSTSSKPSILYSPTKSPELLQPQPSNVAYQPRTKSNNIR